MNRTRTLAPWWWIVNALLVVAILLAAGLGVWKVIERGLVDVTPVADHAEARDDVTKSAAAAVAKILTYKPATIESDLAAGLESTTGDFRKYYQQFTHDVVLPAAKQKQVATSATVVRSGVVTLTADEAALLVFINQSTTSTENPQGTFAASSVAVGMVKLNGTWLIKSFDPV